MPKRVKKAPGYFSFTIMIVFCENNYCDCDIFILNFLAVRSAFMRGTTIPNPSSAEAKTMKLAFEYLVNHCGLFQLLKICYCQPLAHFKAHLLVVA